MKPQPRRGRGRGSQLKFEFITWRRLLASAAVYIGSCSDHGLILLMILATPVYCCNVLWLPLWFTVVALCTLSHCYVSLSEEFSQTTDQHSTKNFLFYSGLYYWNINIWLHIDNVIFNIVRNVFMAPNAEPPS